MTARELPHSAEAEECLLSACVVDAASVIPKCVEARITRASFYDAKHGIVYGAIMDLFGRQSAIDMSIVAEELKTSRQLDAVGGYAGLVEMTQRVPTTEQAVYFVEKVVELATLREIIMTRTATVEACFNFTGGLDEFLAETAASEARAITRESGSEETIQQVAAKVLADVRIPKAQRKPDSEGISWSLVDIDLQCGRMQPGNLIVVAGMPSSGKSALADQVAWRAATRGHQTIVFTYEMTKRDKAIRIAQQVSRLNADDYDNAPADRQKSYTDALQEIINCDSLHVFERDTAIARLVARCRAFSNRHQIGLIVVDFLQYLARLEATIGRERTDEKLGRLTAALKQVAKDCSCPVMMLSSLSREGYRDGQRPTFSSLRSSGEIESDADVVAILHWPKKNPATGADQDPHDMPSGPIYVEFNQEKGRSKGVSTVGLSFERRATRFDNYCA